MISTETPMRNQIHQILGDELRTDTRMHPMTSKDESRKEVSTPTMSLAKPKHELRVGYWNVRTLYETGKKAEVVRAIKMYRFNIFGVNEIRQAHFGIMTFGSGNTVCYSGHSDGQHQEGVDILMDKEGRKTLIGLEAINLRIITARFFPKYVKTIFA